MSQKPPVPSKEDYYSPDNLRTIVPYLPRKPKWLLLGGPADAREAQTAVELWPTIKVIGVEPNPQAVHFQHTHGWPKGAPLVLAALSDHDGVVAMQNPGTDLRHASAFLPGMTGDIPADAPTATAVTWDTIDERFGPCEDAILWMDIEGSELAAVKGARKLLSRDGGVILINVELLMRVGDVESALRVLEVDRLIKSYGFRAVRDWNDSEWCRDRVYVREGKTS